jgi:tRNA modification GTPase
MIKRGYRREAMAFPLERIFMNISRDDVTIAAIGTALSEAGIGIIRISGKNAIQIGDIVFKRKNGQKILKDVSTHTLHYGYIVEQNATKEESTIIDEVLVSVMKAPNSYTGDDTIEINCHGGVYLCRKVLDCVLKAGAKLAQPGEFTKRAFLNGKIDLSKAEAVMDLIQSKNEFTHNNAIKQITGLLKNTINNLREEIITQIAMIEVAIDDPEHMSLLGYDKELKMHCDKWIASINHLLITATEGRILKDGIKTVILGKPNVGKSSFFNLLMNEDRAIVTMIPGTTRDTLEEYINFGDVGLYLVDTAGIRETADPIERIGVEKARKVGSNADLIIYMLDASIPLYEDDQLIKEIIEQKRCLILLNKSDLKQEVTESDVRDWIAKDNISADVITISVKDNVGIEQFRDVVKDYFYKGLLHNEDEMTVTNERQIEELREACNSLECVTKSLQDNMPEDFYTIDLMAAYAALGRILGVEVDDDLVDKIFSSFCVGK